MALVVLLQLATRGRSNKFSLKLKLNKRTNRRTDCATVVMKKADKGEHSAQSGQLELGKKCGKTIRFLRDHGRGGRVGVDTR